MITLGENNSGGVVDVGFIAHIPKGIYPDEALLIDGDREWLRSGALVPAKVYPDFPEWAVQSPGTLCTPVRLPESISFSIAFVGSVFLAIGSNTYCSTDNGASWVKTNLPSDKRINSFAYGNGIFVGISTYSYDVNEYYTSADGITWTPRSGMSTSSSTAWSKVIFSAGRFLAIGHGGLGARVSPDGLKWTAAASSPPNNQYTYIEQGNGRILMIAHTQGKTVISSNGGDTWREVQHQTSFGHLVFANGKFIVTNGNNLIRVSADGEIWTEKKIPSPTVGSWGNPSYCSGSNCILFANINGANSTKEFLLSYDGGETWVIKYLNDAGVMSGGTASNNAGIFLVSMSSWFTSVSMEPMIGAVTYERYKYVRVK